MRCVGGGVGGYVGDHLGTLNTSPDGYHAIHTATYPFTSPGIRKDRDAEGNRSLVKAAFKLRI